MIAADKIKPGIPLYWLIVVLVFTTIGLYGKQSLEWILMKLYEFFIQRNA